MDIAEEIRRNGENGARLLVAEYGNRLYGAALLLCASDADAEDLVFRTFERALAKIRTFAPTGDFFSWLYTILLNLRRMDLRRRGPDIRSVGAPQDLPDAAQAGTGAPAGGATSDAVREAVRGLEDPLREVVVLHYFNDLSVDQIAALLDVPPGTVKSRLHTARGELQEILARPGRETHK